MIIQPTSQELEGRKIDALIFIKRRSLDMLEWIT